jgi:hypothetical protein
MDAELCHAPMAIHVGRNWFDVWEHSLPSDRCETPSADTPYVISAFKRVAAALFLVMISHATPGAKMG